MSGNKEKPAGKKLIPRICSSIGCSKEELFLAVPVFLFFISPLLRLAGNFFAFAALGFEKFGTTLPAEYTNTILAVITLSLFSMLYYLKLQNEKGALKLNRADAGSFARMNLPLVLITVYFVWTIICTCINGFNDRAINGDYYRGEGFYYFFATYFIIFVSALFLENAGLRQTMVRVMLAVSIILGIGAYLDFIFGPLYIFSPYNMRGFLSTVFYNSNYYGYYLTIVVLLSYGCYLRTEKGRANTLYFICYIFNSSILIMNLTRGGFIAVLFTLLGSIFFMKKFGREFRKKACICLVIFLVETVIFSFICETLVSQLVLIIFDILNILKNPREADDAGSERWLLWKCTFKMIMDRPLFGYGNEGISELLKQMSGTHKTRPHNEYLQYAAFWGLPGLALYLSAILSAILRSYKRYDRLSPIGLGCLLASIGYAGAAFFCNTMCFVTPFFYIMMGMAYAEWRMIASSTESPASTDP